MTPHAITSSADLYRRFGSAQRAFTMVPVVPSQDVTRYQARNMPKPKYDLTRSAPTSTLTILFRVLGLVVAGVVMIVIRRVTTLLHS